MVCFCPHYLSSAHMCQSRSKQRTIVSMQVTLWLLVDFRQTDQLYSWRLCQLVWEVSPFIKHRMIDLRHTHTLLVRQWDVSNLSNKFGTIIDDYYWLKGELLCFSIFFNLQMMLQSTWMMPKGHIMRCEVSLAGCFSRLYMLCLFYSVFLVFFQWR